MVVPGDEGGAGVVVGAAGGVCAVGVNVVAVVASEATNTKPAAHRQHLVCKLELRRRPQAAAAVSLIARGLH